MATSTLQSESVKNSRQALQVGIAFGLVYFFWGSTYLAIRIGVAQVPAALLTGVRFLTAGTLMLGWCALSGRKIALNRHDALRIAIIGVLLLSGGNTLLAWTEFYIPSGLAALIVAVVPIWIAIIEGIIPRGEKLTRAGWGGLLLGIAGLIVLLWPELTAHNTLGRPALIACGVVLFGSLCWAAGSIVSRRSSLGVGPFAAAGWEMAIAGSLNLIFSLIVGDQHRAHWTRSSTLAVAYLIVFGSWVGFTAYIWLLEHVPTPKVATYAYVNPIVAVFLGWLIGHERLDRYMFMGMVVIVSAVALVTTSKLRSGARQATQAVAPCESAGD